MSSDQGKEEKIIYCSFCGRGQHDVRKLIAGPDVFICNECVDLCEGIINEEEPQSEGEKKFLVEVIGSTFIGDERKELSPCGSFVVVAMTEEEAVSKFMSKKFVRLSMGCYVPTSNIAEINIRVIDEITGDADKSEETNTNGEAK